MLPVTEPPPVREGAGRRPGVAAAPGPPAAQDTLHVIANADRWVQLTHALDEARVPLAVGDVDAMRRMAKLEQPVLDALTRWISTANRGPGDASGPPVAAP